MAATLHAWAGTGPSFDLRSRVQSADMSDDDIAGTVTRVCPDGVLQVEWDHGGVTYVQPCDLVPNGTRRVSEEPSEREVERENQRQSDRFCGG